MTYCFDIDGTICYTSGKNYYTAIPYKKVIDNINKLYDDGHTIIIFTARGGTSKVDHFNTTNRQLLSWGLKYHNLVCRGKPHFDLLIDDKALNSTQWRNDNNIKIVEIDAKIKDGFLYGSSKHLNPFE